MSLPGWQSLRAELYPKGFEVVTIGLDAGGVDAVRPWIEAATTTVGAIDGITRAADQFTTLGVPGGQAADT